MKKQISKEVVINAEGKRTNGNCKMVYCIETETFYASLTDAAEALGTSIYCASNVICGKQKTCNGFHIFEVSKAKEHLTDIAQYYRDMNLAEMKAKATAWDTYMASKNAKAKAKEELERKREIHIQLVEKANKATAKADKMLMEIQALEGKLMEMEA